MCHHLWNPPVSQRSLSAGPLACCLRLSTSAASAIARWRSSYRATWASEREVRSLSSSSEAWRSFLRIAERAGRRQATRSAHEFVR